MKIKEIMGKVNNTILDFGLYTDDAVNEALQILKRDYPGGEFYVRDREFNFVHSLSGNKMVGSSPVDYINRNQYIAAKLWHDEDISNSLVEDDYIPSIKNLERVKDSGLLKFLNDCTDEDWCIISDAIKLSAVKDISHILNDENVSKKDKLCEIANNEQKILNFYTEDYCERCCIIDRGSTDVSAALEMTLHYLLEHGATDDTISQILGAIKEPPEKDFKECIYIDLGYVIPGSIFII